MTFLRRLQAIGGAAAMAHPRHCIGSSWAHEPRSERF